MKPGQRRALPVAHWPQPDRRAWERACVPGFRLRAGGQASRLSPARHDMLEKSYGQLLSLCALKGWLGHADAPAAMVRSEIIEAFVQDHVARGISAMTTHMRVERILRMARILDPAYDLEWLREIALDLEDRAHPRSKVHKIVDSARLRTAGLDLMRRAERSTGQTNLQRARLYRDGLMIALLTVCPIRLGNFARLQIGQQVRRERDAWWIVLEASETKGRRPDERPIPDEPTSFMDRWVDHWRGFFRAPAGAFWASTKGGNLAYTYVGTTVADITRRGSASPSTPTPSATASSSPSPSAPARWASPPPPSSTPVRRPPKGTTTRAA